MSEELKQEEKTPTISEMLRITAGNNHALLVKIADRIDEMQEEIDRLAQRVIELEGSQDDNSKSQ